LDLLSLDLRISTELRDDAWDRFVEFEANGHFEQTSRWAEVKREGGWDPLRIIIYNNGEIVAGCQILIRLIPLIGKVGNLPKGPLFIKNNENLIDFFIQKIKELIKKYRIQFFIVQAPDNQNLITEYFKKEGFKRNTFLNIPNATTFIDLSEPYRKILSSMTRNFRYNIRFAQRNGINIREGNKNEISQFFKLMLETCKRQAVKPSPSSESFIQKLWEVFSPYKNIKFFLAEYKKEILSGLICIPFGKVFYAWRFGWSGKYEDLRANHLLHWKAIQWAKENGYKYYDFMVIKRIIAEKILKGAHFYSVAKGQDLFKLSFGGEIALLPEAYFYIKNPILRFIYTKVYGNLRDIQILGKYPFKIF